MLVLLDITQNKKTKTSEKNTFYEPRSKSRYRLEGTERMHWEKNSSCRLGPHSIRTRAGDNHWQDRNALLITKGTHARGEAVSCQTGVSEGLDEETPAPRECDAEGRRPRTDEEGEVWRSADAVQKWSRGCSRIGTVKRPRSMNNEYGSKGRMKILCVQQ